MNFHKTFIRCFLCQALPVPTILLLAKFSGIERNIVLIGGNGSGKSSLTNALKGNDTENICVIPAQKSLYFSMNDKKSFFHVMEALRQSNIVIDNETLEMIRTFM